jgi:hypothetical protein
MKRVAAECCQLHSRTLQLPSERSDSTARHDNPVSCLYLVHGLFCNRVSTTLQRRMEKLHSEKLKEPGKKCHSVPYCLDTLDHLTKTAFPVEFPTGYHKNYHSGRFGQSLPTLFWDSRFPFGNIIVLCYCILCDATVCYADSYVN